MTLGGFFLLIDCTLASGNEQDEIRVIQQRHDNFGTQFKRAKPANQETTQYLSQIASKTKNVIHSNLPPKQVEEQLKKLEQLYKKNILTKVEFESKWRMVYPSPVVGDHEGLTEDQKELMKGLKE